jgi:4a-hydroxytetrahydrobiopterin dehydratase
MNNLLKKKCVPCEGGVAPLNHEEIGQYLDEVPGWKLMESTDANLQKTGFSAKICKEFKFQDFIGAINFVERVADVAEMEGHHPDIHVFYNKVVLELSTHAIGGLSENDFILAAKIDAHK